MQASNSETLKSKIENYKFKSWFKNNFDDEIEEEIKKHKTNKRIFFEEPKTNRAVLVQQLQLKELNNGTNGKLILLTPSQEEKKMQHFKTIQGLKPIALISPRTKKFSGCFPNQRCKCHHSANATEK